jgi:ATP-dependent helicase IRC3
MQTVQVEYSGQIQVNTGTNPRELYVHQNEAIKALDQKNKSPSQQWLIESGFYAAFVGGKFEREAAA